MKPTSRGRSESSNPGIPVTVSDTVNINLKPGRSMLIEHSKYMNTYFTLG